MQDCRPSSPCFSTPIGFSPQIGHSLLAEVAQHLLQSPPIRPRDLPQHLSVGAPIHGWEDEQVRVGALNVCLQRMATSCYGAVQLISTCCCELLFLSDLRRTRSNISKTRRIHETDLLGQSTLLTSIGQCLSTSPDLITSPGHGRMSSRFPILPGPPSCPRPPAQPRREKNGETQWNVEFSSCRWICNWWPGHGGSLQSINT